MISLTRDEKDKFVAFLLQMAEEKEILAGEAIRLPVSEDKKVRDLRIAIAALRLVALYLK
jgi:hypothetical protein